MGLEDREYLKYEGGGSSFGYSGGGGGATQSICKLLIIINVGVYLLQIFSGDAVTRWLAMDTDAVLYSAQIWRLLTYGFCHDVINLFHILFNMLFLWWFGPRLESIYGTREFLIFYLSAIVLAALAYIGLDLVTGDPGRMVGASGGVMAIVTLYACHFPRQVIYLMLVIPVEMRWMVGLYAIFTIHPILLQTRGFVGSDGVAHAAHLGGMVFGYFYFRRQWRLDGFVSGMTQWWKVKRSGLKVVGSDEPAPSRRTQRMQDEMDAILTKISEQGEESLTRSERKTLEKASRELRNRRK